MIRTQPPCLRKREHLTQDRHDAVCLVRRRAMNVVQPRHVLARHVTNLLAPNGRQNDRFQETTVISAPVRFLRLGATCSAIKRAARSATEGASRSAVRSPAGSLPASTSPSKRLASRRAVSGVHGEPCVPIVSLRSGAPRPEPKRYCEECMTWSCRVARAYTETLHLGVPQRNLATAMRCEVVSRPFCDFTSHGLAPTG